MKLPLHLAIATLALLTFVGCATKPTTIIEKKPGTDWSKYRTFAVLPMTEHVPGGSPTIINAVIPAILDAVKQGYTAKGYTEAPPESADVVINVTAGWLPRVNVRNWNYVPGYVGSSWYTSYSDFMLATGSVQVDTFEQGKLALQTYDSKTREMIWVGFGTAMKNERLSVPERVHKVRGLILDLLKELPAAPAAG